MHRKDVIVASFVCREMCEIRMGIILFLGLFLFLFVVLYVSFLEIFLRLRLSPEFLIKTEITIFLLHV